MTQYVIAYLGGGKPETPEQGAKDMEKWKTWIMDLGSAVVNPGTPMGNSKIVSKDGISDDLGSDALSGFSIVEADSQEAAIEMAKSCPFLDYGKLQVSQVMNMGG